MANSLTSTKWTFLTFGSVFQVNNRFFFYCYCWLFYFLSSNIQNTRRFYVLIVYYLWHIYLYFTLVLPDKDKDGEFKWVDKSTVQFSNYGPGWPVNTVGIWDCGQIFTGKDWHWNVLSQINLTRFFLHQPSSKLCCRKLWRPVGNHQLLQEPRLHLWDDRWTES